MSIFRANSHKFHEWQKIKIIGNDSKKEFSNYFKIIISLASSCHTIKNPSVLQNIGFFSSYFNFLFYKRLYNALFQGLSVTPHVHLAPAGSPTTAPAIYSATTS